MKKPASIEYKSNGQILAVVFVMSDEFLKLAKKEVDEEISGMEKILSNCTNDAQIFDNSESLQKRTHKIKGLAPMMGKSSMGKLASVLDDILKQTMAGKTPQGIIDVMRISAEKMMQNMNDDSDLEPEINSAKNLLDGI